jgi:hypothetical protein
VDLQTEEYDRLIRLRKKPSFKRPQKARLLYATDFLIAPLAAATGIEPGTQQYAEALL